MGRPRQRAGVVGRGEVGGAGLGQASGDDAGQEGVRQAGRQKVMFTTIGNRCLTLLGWAATTGGSKLFCIYIYIYFCYMFNFRPMK
jgi:hypothetical protein